METALEQCSKVSIFHYAVVQFELFLNFFINSSNSISEMCDLFGSLAHIKNKLENLQTDPWETMKEETVKALERYFTQQSIELERFKEITKFFGEVFNKINKVVDGSIYRKKLDFIADLFGCVAEDIRSRLISQGFNSELNLYYNDFVLKALIQYNPQQGASSIDPNTQASLKKANITDFQLEKVWKVYTAVADIYELNIEQLVAYLRKKRERNELRHFGDKIKNFAKSRQKHDQPVQLAEFAKCCELTELFADNEVQLLEHVFRMCWQTLLYEDQRKFTVDDLTYFNRESSMTVPLNETNPENVKFACNSTAILVWDSKKLKSFNMNEVATRDPQMKQIRWLQGDIHEILAVEDKHDFLLLTSRRLFLMENDYSSRVIIEFENESQDICMTTGGSHIFIYFDNTRVIKHFPKIQKYTEIDDVKTTHIDNKYSRIYRMHLSTSHDFLAMTVNCNGNTYRSIVIFNINIQEIRCISDVVDLSVELAVPVNQWVILSDYMYYLIQMNGAKVSGPSSLQPLKLSKFKHDALMVCQLLRDAFGRLRLSVHGM